METNKDKIDISNKKKRAEEILKQFSEKSEKEGMDFETFKKYLQSQETKELRVRARIPVKISPDVKKVLRQDKSSEQKAKVNLIVDFKEPKARKGRLIISEQKRKEAKRLITVQAPETPSPFSSSTPITQESLNKDILLEKLKRRQIIKKRMKERK